MTDEQTLYDRTAHDRHPDLMRMRQAKEDPCNDNRPSWGWCFGIAAVVIGALALAGVI